MVEVNHSFSSWRAGSEISRFLLDAAAGRAALPPSSPSQLWMELAYRHGLIGVLAREMGEPVRGSVRPVYARLLANQEVIDAHTPRLLTALHRAGIRASVLKGAYLDRHIYRSRGLRTYTDLDVLVPPHQIHRALEVLAADEAVGEVPPRRARAPKWDLPVRDPTGASFNVDLHWDLFGYSQLLGRAQGATDWALAKAGDVEGSLGPHWVLPIEATLAFLGTHALFDHRFRLILFRDLTELTSHDIDWEAVGAFAERFGLRSTTYLALWMAVQVTSAQVPAEVLADLRPRNLPVALAERLLARTDLVVFNGHRVHPLNLAIVLMHDDRAKRIQLVLRAPAGFPGWHRRAAVRSPRRAGALMIVITTNRRRGAEIQGERLAEGLRTRGWDVDLVSLTSDANHPTVEAEPLTDRAPDRLGPLDADVLRGLRKRIRRTRPDVIVANGSATLRYTVVAAGLTVHGPKLVYVSIGEPSYWIRSARHRWQQRLLLSRAHRIVAVSHATGDQLIEQLGVPENRVLIAHSGVPASLLNLTRPPRETGLHLLFLGSLSAEKDPVAALRASAVLNPSVGPRLRFVGTGPLQQELELAIAELGIEELVEFSGSAGDISPHLIWADLLVLTSRTEGLPGAALEAAAAGIPVVAFDVGGTAETVVDGVTGRLIPAGNLDSFVGALKELAADPQLRTRYGTAGRQMVKNDFLIEHVVERYEKILLDVLASN